MKRAVQVCVLALLLCAAAVPATASTFLAMDQAELVAASDAVVIGEVTAVRSFWNEGATAIVTEAFVRVNETLAGDAPAMVVVRTFGGEVGAVKIEAHGFPKFDQGQRLVLYLGADGDAARVIGYLQGQYRIVTRQSDGRDIAVPALDDGARLVSRDGRAVAQPRPVALDTLRAQVRAAADGLRATDSLEHKNLDRE